MTMSLFVRDIVKKITSNFRVVTLARERIIFLGLAIVWLRAYCILTYRTISVYYQAGSTVGVGCRVKKTWLFHHRATWKYNYLPWLYCIAHRKRISQNFADLWNSVSGISFIQHVSCRTYFASTLPVCFRLFSLRTHHIHSRSIFRIIEKIDCTHKSARFRVGQI